ERRGGEAEQAEDRRRCDRLQEDPRRDPVRGGFVGARRGDPPPFVNRAQGASFPRFSVLYRTAICLNVGGQVTGSAMKFGETLARWPLIRQLREGDPLGLGKAAQSEKSRALRPRIDEADHVAQS